MRERQEEMFHLSVRSLRQRLELKTAYGRQLEVAVVHVAEATHGSKASPNVQLPGRDCHVASFLLLRDNLASQAFLLKVAA
jgi:hypothetical protein